MTNAGQTMIEYSLVVGIILTVIIAMQPMIKRGGQAMIKLVADQIGNQEEGDQRSFYDNAVSDSRLDWARTSTDIGMDTQTSQFLGATSYTYSDQIEVDSEQQSNLGFTPEITP